MQLTAKLRLNLLVMWIRALGVALLRFTIINSTLACLMWIRALGVALLRFTTVQSTLTCQQLDALSRLSGAGCCQYCATSDTQRKLHFARSGSGMQLMMQDPPPHSSRRRAEGGGARGVAF